MGTFKEFASKVNPIPFDETKRVFPYVGALVWVTFHNEATYPMTIWKKHDKNTWALLEVPAEGMNIVHDEIFPLLLGRRHAPAITFRERLPEEKVEVIHHNIENNNDEWPTEAVDPDEYEEDEGCVGPTCAERSTT
jgi:hypothetical protein